MNHWLATYSIFCLIGVSRFVLGEGLNSGSMGSGIKTTKELERMAPLEKPISPQKEMKEVLPVPVEPPKKMAQQAQYLHPGIIVNLGGRWEGSDHLLNLTNDIGVYIRIIKPAEATFKTSEQDLQRQVESLFSDAGIKPVTMTVEGKPPLPAFEIEIFIYPIEQGYTAFLDGRLFESVVLERFKLDPKMAFQAITWEKQSLIVSPKDAFDEELKKSVKEIAGTFIDRFHAFEILKKQATY